MAELVVELVVEQKLESLRRCVQRLQDKQPDSIALLETDPDLQDIIVLNLTRCVQLCVDIASHIISRANETSPVSMGEAFLILEKMGVINDDLALKLRKSTGFRNVAIHNYEAINWTIVYAICNQHLSEFKDFTKCVVSYYDL